MINIQIHTCMYIHIHTCTYTFNKGEVDVFSLLIWQLCKCLLLTRRCPTWLICLWQSHWYFFYLIPPTSPWSQIICLILANFILAVSSKKSTPSILDCQDSLVTQFYWSCILTSFLWRLLVLYMVTKLWNNHDMIPFTFQGQSTEKGCDSQMCEWGIHLTAEVGIICSPHFSPLSLPKYGGDISRKMKLLSRQREGKKKMKQIGNVELDRKAFLSVLERNWGWPPQRDRKSS